MKWILALCLSLLAAMPALAQQPCFEVNENTYCVDPAAPEIAVGAASLSLSPDEGRLYPVTGIGADEISVIRTYEGAVSEIGGALFDADGNLVRTYDRRLSNNDPVKITTYRVTPGETYYLVASQEVPIELNIIDGNPLVHAFDPVAFDTPIAVHRDDDKNARYPIDLQDGDRVSIVGPIGTVYLVNGEGDRTNAMFRYFLNDSGYYVLTAEGPPPYVLLWTFLSASSVSEMVVSEGDILLDEQGELAYGAPHSAEFAAPTVAGWYHIPEDTRLTLRIDHPAFTFAQNADGRTLYPAAALETERGEFIASYHLEGAPPYDLYIVPRAPEGEPLRYTLAAEQGDSLRVERGPLPLDSAIAPAAPETVEVYTVDPSLVRALTVQGAQSSSYITLYRSNRSTVYPSDDAGDTLLYELDEDGGPYELHVSPWIDAPFMVLSGSSAEQQGMLGVPATVSGTLSGGTIWAYELAANNGDHVTFTLDGDGTALDVVDSSGQLVSFRAAIEMNNSRTRQSVELVGTAPFSVQLRGTGAFTLQTEAGDSVRVDMGPLAPGELATGQNPDGKVAVYTLTELPEVSGTLTVQSSAGTFFSAFSDSGESLAVGESLWGGGIEVRQFHRGEAGAVELRVLMAGGYQLTYAPTDLLEPEMTVRPGETITQLAASPYAAYTLDATPGEFLTVSGLNGAELMVTNAAGEALPIRAYSFPDASPTGDQKQVIRLDGPQPFTAEVFGYAFEELVLALETGDTVRTYGGELAPGEAASAQIAPNEIHYYTYNAEPGSVFEVATDDLDISLTLAVMDDDMNELPLAQQPFRRGDMGIYPFVAQGPNPIVIQVASFSTAESYTLQVQPAE